MSAGPECTTCKKRRVRCDGVKPNCLRCQKAHRMCVFPDATTKSFVFVSDDARVKKPSKRTGEDRRTKATKSRINARNLELVQWQPPLTNALSLSLADQATAFYFHAHHSGMQDFIEPAQEHASLIPQAFTRTSSASTLRLALLARSHASFGKAKANPLADKESSRLYVQAISMLHQSLLDPIEAGSDEILLAAMVLSSYESTLSFSIDSKGLAPAFDLSRRMLQCFKHHDGAMALLRMRKQRPATPTDLNLDKLVRRQVLRSALLRGRGIPDFLEFGEHFGESGVPLGLDRHMAQLIKGQRYARLMQNYYQVALEKGQPLNKAPLSALIHEMQRLDSDMLSWAQSLGPDWWYETAESPDYPGLSQHPMVGFHSYKSPGHAAIWNRHRTVRIIVKKVSIELLRLAEEFFNEECELPMRSISGSIRDLINDVCASSVLASIGSRVGERVLTSKTDAGAEKLLNATQLAHLAFPLHAIVDALPFANVPIAQEHWIRNCLYEVGKTGNDTILEQVALQSNANYAVRSTTPD